ncbi:universal stress protein [Glaciibacter superstes]|uniref:universal stress protein n=1 Tax=Glaciibacter superstes TaxID=501023 RepID=UPI0003B6471F|nr:universal stress protein [Glaciibacter superstes]
MIETTVVGWDGTEPAVAALSWAIDEPPGRTLRLVRVAGKDVSDAETFAANSPAALARVALIDEAERIRRAHPDRKVTSELVTGDPVDELARRSNASTLVVVGTGRRHGGSAKYGWSVGARLAGVAQGPVAIIPVTNGSRRGGIVVGIDGSAASDVALRYAAAEAVRLGVPLRAIRAWQPPPTWAGASVPAPDYLRSLEEMYTHVLDDALEEVLLQYPDLDLGRTVVRAPAHTALLGASRTAALLVVGNHGLRGLKRLLLGSVSHSVIINAQSPVVVVRAD